jgi:hypothetical protein
MERIQLPVSRKTKNISCQNQGSSQLGWRGIFLTCSKKESKSPKYFVIFEAKRKKVDVKIKDAFFTLNNSSYGIRDV